MGQYYHPTNEDRMENIYSHDYGAGLKLMEHSWVGNNFVQTVEHLLSAEGAWFKCRLTWSGDYGDRANELGPAVTIKIPESDKQYPYILNHDTKEYVDQRKTPMDSSEWQIHPLPLLTCDGNGRGGGDFRGEDPRNLVGSWAGNHISTSELKPEEDWTEIVFDLVEH